MKHAFTVEVPHPDRDELLTVSGQYYPAQKATRTDPSWPAYIEIESLQNENGSTPLDDGWADLMSAVEENTLIEAEDYLADQAEGRIEDAADAKRELIREREL